MNTEENMEMDAWQLRTTPLRTCFALQVLLLTQKGTVSSKTLFLPHSSVRESSPNEIRVKSREESLLIYGHMGSLLLVTSSVTLVQ